MGETAQNRTIPKTQDNSLFPVQITVPQNNLAAEGVFFTRGFISLTKRPMKTLTGKTERGIF